MINIPKFFYESAVHLMSNLGAYKERTDKYVEAFKNYIGNTRTILDAGCGSGEFARKLAKNTIVALDIQKQLLKEIKGESIHKICADVQYLPLRENSIDYVLSLSLIEHLKEPEKHIKEIHRVLKRKGIFIIQIPNLQYIFEPHSKWPFLFLFPRRIQLIIFKTLNYPLFVNMKVNIKKTLLLLQEEKFKIREIKKVYHLTIMELLPIAPSYIIISEKC